MNFCALIHLRELFESKGLGGRVVSWRPLASSTCCQVVEGWDAYVTYATPDLPPPAGARFGFRERCLRLPGWSSWSSSSVFLLVTKAKEEADDPRPAGPGADWVLRPSCPHSGARSSPPPAFRAHASIPLRGPSFFLSPLRKINKIN